MTTTFPKQQNTPQTLAQAPVPQADLARKRDMAQAWKAYRGRLLDPLKVENDQPNDNVKPNRCKPIVQKGVAWLFGPELKIEATEERQGKTPPMSKAPASDTEASGPIQTYIDGMWGDADKKMTLLGKGGVNGGCFGHVFFKLIPASGSMRYHRIVNLNPQVLRIVTAGDDCDLHIAYIIEYPAGQNRQKKQIIARVDPNGTLDTAGEEDLDDFWTITNYERTVQAGQSSLIDEQRWEQVGAPEVWDYPFPPIFTNQNLLNPNEAWGEPDLTGDLIEMNDALNFNRSTTQRITKHHAHPLTYAVNMRADMITTTIDGVLCLPAPDSKLEKLAPMDNFNGLLSVAASLRDDMDEQSQVPAVALGRLESLPKGNISGVALQLLFQPLIEKTVQKQRLYGAMIRAITRAGLVLAGLITVEQYEDYPIEIHWQSVLPADDLQAAQTALIYEQLGVSESTLLQRLGFDPDDEADKKAGEDAKKLTAFSRGQGMPPTLPNQPGQQQPPASPFMGRDGGQGQGQ